MAGRVLAAIRIGYFVVRFHAASPIASCRIVNRITYRFRRHMRSFNPNPEAVVGVACGQSIPRVPIAFGSRLDKGLVFCAVPSDRHCLLDHVREHVDKLD